MKLLKDLRLNKIDNLISLATFGSYGTKYWRNGSSDIDIFILMFKREDIMDEIDFRLYVNKYLRENEWLIRKTREDTKFLEDVNGSSIL